jgi:hypothetical protein
MIVKIISKVDKHLVVTPRMRGLPNEEELRIDLPADQPVEVPDYIANYYIKNYPHVYRLEGQQAQEDATGENNSIQTNPFDPLNFLEMNYSRIEEASKSLEKKELLAVAKVLKLNGAYNQKTDRIIERIVQDVKVKQEQQEELEKHKKVQ